MTYKEFSFEVMGCGHTEGEIVSDVLPHGQCVWEFVEFDGA